MPRYYHGSCRAKNHNNRGGRHVRTLDSGKSTNKHFDWVQKSENAINSQEKGLFFWMIYEQNPP